ncbi:MAG TPA: ROK family protein [Candidatus Paceibacterota bacterium]|jgi:predicted NBD/HSP70 family sugar kinase|nr:ROK family protein [Candidatus Paceibacterota bacterium]
MYLLADIGGTKTRLAASKELQSFSDPVVFATPAEPAALAQLLMDEAYKLTGGAAAPLMIGKPIYMDIEKEVRKRAGAEVYFENDTALVGLGEAHHGAGKGSAIFAYITVSTGVNGVRIVDGSIDRSARGFEIGGQYLATEGTTSLEDLISGRSVETHYGVHPKELGTDHPFWEEAARVLAYGLHNTISHWSPDTVAIGGSMMNEIGIPLPRVEAHLEAIRKKYPVLPKIVHSELGDLGGLWGGLQRLKELTA